MKKPVAAAGMALLLAATPAYACAVLEHANPRVGATVSGSLDALQLHFSLQIYPKQSSIKVTAADGTLVSLGPVIGDAADDKTVAVHLRSLTPGKYKVTWDVLADCGSHEPGDFKFTVAEPGTVSKYK